MFVVVECHSPGDLVRTRLIDSDSLVVERLKQMYAVLESSYQTPMIKRV